MKKVLLRRQQDQYGEHPEERAAKNVEATEKLGDVQTLTNIFTKLKEKVLPEFLG
jgi:hypothetical protein